MSIERIETDDEMRNRRLRGVRNGSATVLRLLSSADADAGARVAEIARWQVATLGELTDK